MNLSIIIPNYNGEQIIGKNLVKVLSSITDYNSGSVELIISDDASMDNSIKIIKDFIDKDQNSKINIKLLVSNKNKNEGFSSNVNKGVAFSSGELVVLLNSDVIPNKNFINPLIKHFENEKVFAVGCMDESLENGKIILRGRGVGKWDKGFLVHSAGDLSKTDTLWVSGGSGAFRRSIWDKLGGLDEIYNPFYWEDIDLSYRALKSGYITLFEKSSVVRHEHDEGVIKKKYQPARIKRIVYRNQFVFAWKNSDFGTLISHLFWLPYHLLTAIFSKDLSLISGFIFALGRLPRIITSRKRARKYFIKSDKEITASIQ